MARITRYFTGNVLYNNTFLEGRTIEAVDPDDDDGFMELEFMRLEELGLCREATEDDPEAEDGSDTEVIPAVVDPIDVEPFPDPFTNELFTDSPFTNL